MRIAVLSDIHANLPALDAVLDGAPLIAPLEDAIGTSELLHAIWDSHNLEIRVPVHRATIVPSPTKGT